MSAEVFSPWRSTPASRPWGGSSGHWRLRWHKWWRNKGGEVFRGVKTMSKTRGKLQGWAVSGGSIIGGNAGISFLGKGKDRAYGVNPWGQTEAAESSSSQEALEPTHPPHHIPTGVHLPTLLPKHPPSLSAHHRIPASPPPAPPGLLLTEPAALGWVTGMQTGRAELCTGQPSAQRSSPHLCCLLASWANTRPGPHPQNLCPCMFCVTSGPHPCLDRDYTPSQPFCTQFPRLLWQTMNSQLQTEFSWITPQALAWLDTELFPFENLNSFPLLQIQPPLSCRYGQQRNTKPQQIWSLIFDKRRLPTSQHHSFHHGQQPCPGLIPLSHRPSLFN